MQRTWSRRAVSAEAFSAALAETAGEDAALDALADGTPTVLVLGQYLAALRLVEPAEEIGMQREMINRALQWQPGRVVFKPPPQHHPPSPTPYGERARAAASTSSSTEARCRPNSSPSDWMPWASSPDSPRRCRPSGRCTGNRSPPSGSERMLQRLHPVENGNRVPATSVDALHARRLAVRGARAVAAADRRSRLRDAAEDHGIPPPACGGAAAGSVPKSATATSTPPGLRGCDCPGAPPESLPRRMLRSAGGVGRVEELRLSIHGARRRAQRAWKVVRG